MNALEAIDLSAGLVGSLAVQFGSQRLALFEQGSPIHALFRGQRGRG